MANLKDKKALEFKKSIAIYSLINGKSIKEVAEAVGETPETISKWFNATKNKAEREVSQVISEIALIKKQYGSR